ncbi:DUF7133 domain-containing protein [Roseibacillus ishigakijimensis]|uniref:DUF7133 domain-containing protein n=1 Tax=Roseibacillus ishigakijimensis TaxID=454146 RepID=A0A934RT51_9BACT|nr:hypothetical protein [Roseibacillus ishigakijimensis]MBK1834579.1 hypothetical protein [Roseibacillus ishigakijimensis]
MKTKAIALGLALGCSPGWGDDYYRTEEIPMPEGEVMEVGSIALLPGKKVAVASRRGDVWICEGAYGDDLSQVSWSKFAEGLHEPFGMFWRDGWLWLTQRPEVTKMRDSDGDGWADEFVTVSAPWGINGDYHEYAFGSDPDRDGNVWVALCLTGSGGAADNSPFRGWGFRITPEGEALPTVTGIRSPGGIGFNAAGDTFYCDNQGLWNGSSSLKHMRVGGFMGNPTGNKYHTLQDTLPEPPTPESGSRIETERAKYPELVPPAVVFPHGLIGQSPTGIIPEDSAGRFGPFAGQTLVGEQTHSQVQRVFLEKVNGVYQGAVWHFLEGYRSGIVPLRLSEDGTLFVGGTNRGWAARGGKPFTFERTRWTGKVPFEMKEMRLTQEGWELVFTQPVNAERAGDPASYEMAAWTYIYQSSYGSPQVDAATPKVVRAEVAEDRLSVRLTVEGRVKGHVHELDASRVTGPDGASLWHPKSYYTINEWVR